MAATEAGGVYGMTKPSPKQIHALLEYNPSTGLFRWKAPSNHQPTGWFKGNKGLRQYRRIWINGHHFLAQHIAYVLMVGHWPRVDLDHRNRKQDNNWWINLRPLGRRRNAFNRSLNKNNKTGFRGVSHFGKRFRATIRCDRKFVSLGLFDDPYSAARAYNNAAVKLYGDAYVP